MYPTLQSFRPWPNVVSTRKTVGIPTHQFDFFAASQHQSQWCWAAAIQMILGWFGAPVSQEQIVERIKGAPFDEPGCPGEIVASLDGFVAMVGGRLIRVYSRAILGRPKVEAIIRQLAKNIPLLTTFISGPSIRHAVVITEVIYI